MTDEGFQGVVLGKRRVSRGTPVEEVIRSTVEKLAKAAHVADLDARQSWGKKSACDHGSETVTDKEIIGPLDAAESEHPPGIEDEHKGVGKTCELMEKGDV